ncbi:MAG: translation elongation factor Ts [Actinobacteria bacterium]|nr:translation elongation factor Ts [Actinomycetota bacterium]MBM3697776.1 translation elongation factor Ts [Actinomycetota bacterium]
MSTAQIPAALVKELREKTGAGMMDCKKALTESGGDLEEAATLLRKQGLADAAKRSGRDANEGTIASYIHQGGQLGVIVEVNCETDFVARTDRFQQFARDVALNVAAMKPIYVSVDDVPEEYKAREREVYAEQAKDKPENAREKIVEGKLAKHLGEICLLEQPFFRDATEKKQRTMEELRAKTSSELGENITIRRFTVYQLGE